MRKNWKNSPKFVRKVDKTKILPVVGETNILITSALPYVNNVPHLGNIIGCVLSADVFARYCRQKDFNCLFICGTDEYGTATETKALQENVAPKEICDKYFLIHKAIYEWFNIEFDNFGRTTTEHQTELTQEIFLNIFENGYTSIATLDQLFCGNCKRFLADRYVHGECPMCHFDDARGDQCDGCGKLINAVELINPRCQICNLAPIVKPSKHIFVRLDLLSDDVEKHLNNVINDKNSKWSTNAISIAKSWIKGGLEKRCITRDMKWGIPVPLPDFADKVFYVWFDAPIGYISITKELLGDKWVHWWKNPANVELYNFVGKDNVAFHSVMFPACLIATGNNFTLVNHLCATEHLNYENTKFSKSRGTGVFGDMAKETGIEADIWRFYLLYMRPETQDTTFAWNDFALKVNSELSNNLGNFINRALSFITSAFNGVVPNMKLSDDEIILINEIENDLIEYNALLSSVKLREGITKILAMSRRGNLYMQSMKPWTLIKGNEQQRLRAGTIVGVAANISYLLAIVLHPYMPNVSRRIREQCGLPELPLIPEIPIEFLPEGHKIGLPKPLFVKIEDSTVEKFKKRFGDGKQNSETSFKEKLKKTVDIKEKISENSVDKNFSENASKERMRRLSSLVGNQKEIETLLRTASIKFEERKKQFIRTQLAEMEMKKTNLQAEVEKLKSHLIQLEIAGGIKQVPVDVLPQQNHKVNNTKNKIENESRAEESDSLETMKVIVAENGNKSKKLSKTNERKDGDDTIDIGRLDLRVGRILKAEKHPDADALYVEQIDVGEEKPRTVISGLVRFVPVEMMQNRLVICLCNLKPVKMRGIESQAMVMCASTVENVEILEVDSSSVPGQRILCRGFRYRPDSVLNPKKKIWETIAVDLFVDEDGYATYRNKRIVVEGIETPITAPTLRKVPIK